jgi:hypothetical protein
MSVGKHVTPGKCLRQLQITYRTPNTYSMVEDVQRLTPSLSISHHTVLQSLRIILPIRGGESRLRVIRRLFLVSCHFYGLVPSLSQTRPFLRWQRHCEASWTCHIDSLTYGSKENYLVTLLRLRIEGL